jgi:hypothetical protein
MPLDAAGRNWLIYNVFRRGMPIPKHSFWSKIDSFELSVTKMALGKRGSKDPAERAKLNTTCCRPPAVRVSRDQDLNARKAPRCDPALIVN